jgi:hypothetical protein
VLLFNCDDDGEHTTSPLLIRCSKQLILTSLIPGVQGNRGAGSRAGGSTTLGQQPPSKEEEAEAVSHHTHAVAVVACAW